MALMNLTSHLSHATEHIMDQLAHNTTHPFAINPTAKNTHVPFFETTIRYLGSLLSTYAITNNHDLLVAADKLGTALLPAFDTPSGLPRWGVDPITYFSHPSFSVAKLIDLLGAHSQTVTLMNGRRLYSRRLQVVKWSSSILLSSHTRKSIF